MGAILGGMSAASHPERPLAFRSAAALLFGALALAWPDRSIEAFATLLVGYWLADGLVGIAWAVRGRERGAMLWGGVASLGAAAFALWAPGLAPFSLLVALATWALLRGLIDLYDGTLRVGAARVEVGVVIAGVISIALAGYLLSRPSRGVLALAPSIGLFAIGIGAALAFAARALRRG
jgi:uncharacterized membrane protein HdeD (DUF308 family)